MDNQEIVFTITGPVRDTIEGGMKLDQLKQIINGLPDYMDDQDVKIRFNPYKMKRRFEPSWKHRVFHNPAPEIDGDDPDNEWEDEIKDIEPNYGHPGIFIDI